MLARSDASAWRAEEAAQKLCAKVDDADAARIKVTTDPADLAECDVVVEAIAEELDAKAELFRTLAGAAPDAALATTTSSLSISAIAEASGAGGRLFGLHPFNPVVRMELVELCVPEGAQDGIAARARAWCESIGKTVVDVPDEAGFVVNRLLFPYLFDAVRLLEQTGMEPEEVDRCMTLGAAYPMGPLALLDLVGLDVAVAIGEALLRRDARGAPPPARPRHRPDRRGQARPQVRRRASTTTAHRAAATERQASDELDQELGGRLADRVQRLGVELVDRVLGGVRVLVVEVDQVDRRDPGEDERDVVVDDRRTAAGSGEMTLVAPTRPPPAEPIPQLRVRVLLARDRAGPCWRCSRAGSSPPPRAGGPAT